MAVLQNSQSFNTVYECVRLVHTCIHTNMHMFKVLIALQGLVLCGDSLYQYSLTVLCAGFDFREKAWHCGVKENSHNRAPPHNKCQQNQQHKKKSVSYSYLENNHPLRYRTTVPILLWGQ